MNITEAVSISGLWRLASTEIPENGLSTECLNFDGSGVTVETRLPDGSLHTDVMDLEVQAAEFLFSKKGVLVWKCGFRLLGAGELELSPTHGFRSIYRKVPDTFAC